MQLTSEFEPKFSTKPLLRPHQVDEAKGEMASMTNMLNSPQTQNKPQIAKQLRAIKLNYEAQVPKTPAVGSSEEAHMIDRSKWLLEQIVPSMCSQEEMRKAPPGAVDKFRKGENGSVIKPLIAEWQNLQLRLNPGDTEAANLERHRPKISTLNMDNAAVPGKFFFLPPPGSGMPVVFTDDQLAAIRLIDPDTADKLALMPNDVRAKIKGVLEGAGGETVSDKPVIKTKRKLTVKQKAALKAGRDKKNKKVLKAA